MPAGLWIMTESGLRPAATVPGPPGAPGVDGATKNATVSILPTEFVERLLRIHDGSDSSTWEDYLQFQFKDQGDSFPQVTSWFNEFGEFRVIPAKPSTVGWRMFLKNSPTDPDRSYPAWQVCDDRTNRGVIVEIDETGIHGVNVNQRVETHPTGTAVPAGLPDGTLWIEYDPT